MASRCAKPGTQFRVTSPGCQPLFFWKIARSIPKTFLEDRTLISISFVEDRNSISRIFLDDLKLNSSFFKTLKRLAHVPIPRFDATCFPTSSHGQSVLSIAGVHVAID